MMTHSRYTGSLGALITHENLFNMMKVMYNCCRTILKYVHTRVHVYMCVSTYMNMLHV